MDDARFRVGHTLTLSSRNLFFVLGDVVEGVVRIGMVATCPPSFHEAIHAVEFARHAQRREEVALGFRYAHDAELAAWNAISWEGATLEAAAGSMLHPCPCCGFRKLPEDPPGTFFVCPVCGWEDDFVQYRDPDFRGGANEMSLNEARAAFFAAHPRFAPRRDG